MDELLKDGGIRWGQEYIEVDTLAAESPTRNRKHREFGRFEIIEEH